MLAVEIDKVIRNLLPEKTTFSETKKNEVEEGTLTQ